MDLHPYDNRVRRFCHTDASADDGRAVVARVLRLPAPLSGEAFFDLSFFSGGSGICDRLAITLPADPAVWSRVADSLCGRTPEEASADAAWVLELLWLMTDTEEAVPIRSAATCFINRERRGFQTECVATSRILFRHGSDVNDWAVLWGDDTRLNYLGYGEG